MSETHTSYEVSKRLKEFLGDNLPKPMGLRWWIMNQEKPSGAPWLLHEGDAEKYDKMGTLCYPAYRLEDLLSKPFTDAMFKKIGVVEMTDTDMGIDDDYDVFLKISYAYYEGGLPAVEKALCEMMEDK